MAGPEGASAWANLLESLGLTASGPGHASPAGAGVSSAHSSDAIPKTEASKKKELSPDQAGPALPTKAPALRHCTLLELRTAATGASHAPGRSAIESPHANRPKHHCTAPEKKKPSSAPESEISPPHSAVTFPPDLSSLAAPPRDLNNVPPDTQHSLLRKAGIDGTSMAGSTAAVPAASEHSNSYAPNASLAAMVQRAEPEPAGGSVIPENIQPDVPPLKLPPQEQLDPQQDRSQPAVSRASADAAATFTNTPAPPDPETFGNAVQPKAQISGSTHPRKATGANTKDPSHAENRSEVHPATVTPSLPLREITEFASLLEKRASSPHSATAPGAVQVPDPFASIDAGRNVPAPTWIHAGARHAEAGYLDPSLGWISVRADAATSGVHAALVPASSEAAQVLGNHLAGLNNYLAERHGDAATVTMAAPQDFAGSGANAQQQQERQPSRDDPTPSTQEQAFPRDRVAERSVLRVSAPAPPQSYAAGARYISVLA